MSHLHQAVLLLSCFYMYSGVREVSCLLCRVNGARMPAFYPLRASTLPLRYDDLSTKHGYSGEDSLEICDISKPTSVVYSTLFRRSVSNHSFRPIIPPPLSRSFAQITSVFLCSTISYSTGSAILIIPPQSRAICSENRPPETRILKGPFHPLLCLEA